MKIVVLDGYTLNPGDLSWDDLKKLGDTIVLHRTPAAETVKRAAGADILLTNKVVLSKEVLDQLPSLKYIGVLATGYNVVDLKAAEQRRIPVTNVPSYGTQSVAQMVFAHILNLTQHVYPHATSVRTGRWSSSEDFCYWDSPLIELAGKTLGLVGLGKIGQATARIGLAFGMHVVAYDPAGTAVDGVEAVDLDTLLERSDVVSLHCPLTSENEGFINRKRLQVMKPTAFLINTGRGPLINEDDLAEALAAGSIAAAGLDVLSVEPPPADHPLIAAKNCYITPHIAWATRESRARLMATAVDNVRAFLNNEPTNVVNGL